MGLECVSWLAGPTQGTRRFCMRSYSRSGRMVFEAMLEPQEAKIARLICERGLRTKQIAWNLGMPEPTVKTYASNLRSKMHVVGSLELMLLYWTI